MVALRHTESDGCVARWDVIEVLTIGIGLTGGCAKAKHIGAFAFCDQSRRASRTADFTGGTGRCTVWNFGWATPTFVEAIIAATPTGCAEAFEAVFIGCTLRGSGARGHADAGFSKTVTTGAFTGFGPAFETAGA